MSANGHASTGQNGPSAVPAEKTEVELGESNSTAVVDLLEQALQESEERHHTLIEGLPAAFYITDSEGRITFYNSAAVELWGREPQLGTDRWCGSFRIYSPDGTYLPHERCPMAVCLKEARPVNGHEVIIERPDGTRRNVLLYPKPLLNKSGNVIGASKMLIDITDRKRAETQLAAVTKDLGVQLRTLTRLHQLSMKLAHSSQLAPCLQSVLETLIELHGADLGLVSLYNTQSACLDVVASVGFSDVALRMLEGVTNELGMGACANAYATQSRTIVEDIEQSVICSKSLDFARRTGFRAVHSTPIFTRAGEILGVISVHFRAPRIPSEREIQFADMCAFDAGDIVEVSNYQAELKKSEERFRKFADSAPAMLWTINANGECTFLSRGWYEFTGQDESSGLGFGSLNAIHPNDRERAREAFQIAKEKREGFTLDYRIRRVDGVYRWAIDTGRPQFSPDGELIGFIGSVIDITERYEAQERLRQSEERFRLMANSCPALIWMSDATNERVWFNTSWLEFTGHSLEQELRESWVERIHPEDRERWQSGYEHAVATASDFQIEYRLLRHDGEYRWLLDNGVPLQDSESNNTGYIGSCIDITDRVHARQSLERHQVMLEEAIKVRTSELERSNERLRLAERMASLGTLSAGLGHDMGNLLVPVRVRLDALANAGLSPELAENIHAIKASAEYLQRLANGLRMLALDPTRTALSEPTEILSWWKDAGPLLKNAVPRGVELKSSLLEKDCCVAIARPALTQVIFNLVQNAGDAMRARGKGTVTISFADKDDVIEIQIADDGPGMTEEVKRRCMEPFFTTKTRNISTGLGLALVFGLVRDVGGQIAIESERGIGTTFTISVPKWAMTESQSSKGAPAFAIVDIEDPRLSAFAIAELRALSFDVATDLQRYEEADLIITGRIPPPGVKKTSRIIFVGAPLADDLARELHVVEGKASPKQLREAIRTVMISPSTV